MATENNKQLMNRFVDFINTASEQLAAELISPEAIFYVPGQPEPMHGPAGYLAIIGMMRSGFPDIQWDYAWHTQGDFLRCSGNRKVN